MREIEWKDGRAPRGRERKLVFLTPDGPVLFRGKTIPGVVVVVGESYEKAGKWSHFTYKLQVPAGVRPVAMVTGWETGRFTEGLAAALGVEEPNTWAEVGLLLACSPEQARKFVLEECGAKSSAERIDRVEAELASASKNAPEKEIVMISFGNPTSRERDEGFWSSPKQGKTEDGRVVTITPADGELGPDWNKCTSNIGTVVEVTHHDGYRGGYYIVKVVV